MTNQTINRDCSDCKTREALDAAIQAELEAKCELQAARIAELEKALAEQPAQQEPVAAQGKFDAGTKWMDCDIDLHHLVQSDPKRWSGYQTRLLYASSSPPKRKLFDFREDWELCEAKGKDSAAAYFKTRPEIDAAIYRIIFQAGYRAAWLTKDDAIEADNTTTEAKA